MRDPKKKMKTKKMENIEEQELPKWFPDSRKCPKVVSFCPMEQCPF